MFVDRVPFTFLVFLEPTPWCIVVLSFKPSLNNKYEQYVNTCWLRNNKIVNCMMVDCNYYLACISASVQSILISVQDGLDISGFNTTFPNVKSKNVGSMSHFSLLPYTRPWILWWLYSKFANFTACLNLLHLPDLPILLHVLISFIPPPPRWCTSCLWSVFDLSTKFIFIKHPWILSYAVVN